MPHYPLRNLTNGAICRLSFGATSSIALASDARRISKQFRHLSFRVLKQILFLPIVNVEI